jgi:hypothetical protein
MKIINPSDSVWPGFANRLWTTKSTLLLMADTTQLKHLIRGIGKHTEEARAIENRMTGKQVRKDEISHELRVIPHLTGMARAACQTFISG